MRSQSKADPRVAAAANDEGYLLLGLVVACFLLLLFLAVAAPRVAKQLEHDREVESEHRAEQYVRAIQLFYRKTHRFPTSVEELLGTNTPGGISSALHVKYLRQAYKDPLTGGEYRLIPVGKAKTEVKGFFGEPLEGAPIGNLGSVAGLVSNSGFAGAGSTAGGSSGGFSLGSGSTFGGTQNSSAGAAAGASSGSTGSNSSASGSSSSSSSGSGSSTSASTFGGSKQAFLGVGSNAKGHGLVEWNGSENIEDWEFLYDPRVEVLKARVSLFGGSPAASGSGSLGGTLGSGNGVNGSSTFGSSSNSLGSGFGSSGSQAGFGSSSSQTSSSTSSSGSSDPNAAAPAR